MCFTALCFRLPAPGRRCWTGWLRQKPHRKLHGAVAGVLHSSGSRSLQRAAFAVWTALVMGCHHGAGAELEASSEALYTGSRLPLLSLRMLGTSQQSKPVCAVEAMIWATRLTCLLLNPALLQPSRIVGKSVIQ